MPETGEEQKARTPHCGPDCPHDKPVRPGGDYPDDWVPGAIYYAFPKGYRSPDSFEEHALDTLQFPDSRVYQGTCMECGFRWPIKVHEDRRDQHLRDYDLWCPHCGSEAVVARERDTDA